MKLSGSVYFEKTWKNLKSNLVLRVVLVFESKGLYLESFRFEDEDEYEYGI